MTEKFEIMDNSGEFHTIMGVAPYKMVQKNDDEPTWMILKPECVNPFYHELRFLFGTGSGKSLWEGKIGDTFHFTEWQVRKYQKFDTMRERMNNHMYLRAYRGIDNVLCYVEDAEEVKRLSELVDQFNKNYTKEQFFSDCIRLIRFTFGIEIPNAAAEVIFSEIAEDVETGFLMPNDVIEYIFCKYLKVEMAWSLTPEMIQAARAQKFYIIGK